MTLATLVVYVLGVVLGCLIGFSLGITYMQRRFARRVAAAERAASDLLSSASVFVVELAKETKRAVSSSTTSIH